MNKEIVLIMNLNGPRKLLMHKSEINKLHAHRLRRKDSLESRFNFHFSHGYVKVTVGLVTGKKLYDKRQDMAERDAKRDIAKRLKEQQNIKNKKDRVMMARFFVIFVNLSCVFS